MVVDLIFYQAGDERSGLTIVTLKRKCMISPSQTTYSLAFYRHFPGLAYCGLAAKVHVVVIFDNLGTDKAFLRGVGMDDSRRAGALSRDGRGPRANLVGAGGKVGLKVE